MHHAYPSSVSPPAQELSDLLDRTIAALQAVVREAAEAGDAMSELLEVRVHPCRE